jgi:RNA polymerase sigma-70 factor (family 1)
MKSVAGERELVKRLKKGNLDAFDEIYHRYHLKVYFFAFKYLKSDTESKEILQTAFLKIWENRSILKSELSFHSYLFTICYNEICKYFRKRSYHLNLLKEKMTEEASLDTITDDGLHYKNILQNVYSCLDKLPEKQREAFIKSRIDGKSTREIALEMDLSPGTIDNYVSEVQKILREKFKGVLAIY